MKYRYIYILITTIGFSQFNYGQNYYNTHDRFLTIFEGASKANPYFLSGNPAYLEYDGRDELLSIQANLENTDGNFKKFFEPGTNRQYEMTFSGKKILENSQIFKGIFSVQKLERRNWNYLAVKNYSTGSPFLLGDSTTGGSRYNGIFMNAQYSARLFNRLLTGFSINYYVDEGLKEVSPRPTSDHRDIDAGIGIGYELNNNLSLGGSLRAYDYNESIQYSEDIEAIYAETILFKFRGLDLPEILKKTTESRVSYHNGYEGKLDVFYKTKNISAALFGGNNSEHIIYKDNLSNPESKGYWENNSISAGGHGSIILNENLTLGVLYKFTRNDMWGKHPEFDVLLNSQIINLHEIVFGVEYILSERLSAGIEVTSYLSGIECSDYYSRIFYEIDNLAIAPTLGISYVWASFLKTDCAIGIITSSNNTFDLIDGNTSSFYKATRAGDVYFLSNEFSGTNFYLKAELNPGFAGLINIYVGWQKLAAAEDSLMNFNNRKNLQAAIEFKIKAY